MNIINIYRYLYGFVRIRIERGFTERFFNLCNIKGISLWDVEYGDKGVSLNIYASDFSKLRQIREKSGVTIKIIYKKGLYFFYKKHKNRTALFVGMAFTILFMFVMNMFLWNIEVTGINSLSDEQITEVTEKLGLRIGMFVPTFDENEVSRMAVNYFDGKISWMAINIKGSKATIEVRDYIEKEDKKRGEEPCNFISDYDGIIINTNTFSGEQKAFPGQTVKKGSLLISGVYENTDGSTNYIHSDGLFSAMINRSFKKNYPSENTFFHVNPEKEYHIIELMHLKFPLSYNAFFKTKNELSYSSHLTFEESKLPFTIKKTAILNEEYPEKERLPLVFCIDDFTSSEYKTFSMSEILKSDYIISISNTGISITCNYKSIDFIGKKVPIKKEN